MFMCVEYLCFSNIPSKSDRYKYYCPRFFLGKIIPASAMKACRVLLIFGEDYAFIFYGLILIYSFVC